jgi:GT2 family glycosyltransferase
MTEIARLEIQLAQAEQTRIAATAQLDAVYATRSWRWTAPLRWAITRFREQPHTAPLVATMPRVLPAAGLSRRGDVAGRSALVAALMQNPPPMGSPLVTVVIPCYNYGHYVEEALASVLAQTIEDVEIIIVDDGSDDPFTVDLLNRLEQPRLRVLHQTNAGSPTARNAGISEASGKYICCLDADDTIEPTYLEKAVTVMEARSDIGFVASWVRLFGDQNGLWKFAPFDVDRIVKQNQLCVSAVFRRDLCLAAGGFSQRMLSISDWEFWLRLGSLGVGGWCVPEPLLNYRQHGGSMLGRTVPIHEELIACIRALNPEMFDPAFRSTIKAARHPIPAAAPFAWLSQVQYRTSSRPGLLVLAPRLEMSEPARAWFSELQALRETHDLHIVTTDDTPPDWTADASLVAAPETLWDTRCSALTSQVYHLHYLLDVALHEEFLLRALEAWGIESILLCGYAREPEVAAKLRSMQPTREM